jgi:adenylate kinase
LNREARTFATQSKEGDTVTPSRPQFFDVYAGDQPTLLAYRSDQDSQPLEGPLFEWSVNPTSTAAVISVTAKCGPIPYCPIDEVDMAAQNNNDRAAWLQGPTARCAVVPETVETPWRIVLLGAPGVGKGTQADLLNQRLGACHLSTGDVFRAAKGRDECELSPAMKAALEYMRRGDLVPDATVWDMVRERSGCLRCGGGFILDGFPRTLAQAESLEQLMGGEGLSLTAVVNYELPVSAIVARLSGRRTCETCKAVFHATERPPKVAGTCDRCSGKLFQREDDRPESIKIRLEAYDRSTAPLIAFYKNLGLLLPVAATGSPEDICARTLAELTAWRAGNSGSALTPAQTRTIA